MRLLERALDGVKLALLGAQGAAHALARVDVRFLARLEIGLHRARRAGVCTSHAAHAFLVINLGNAVLHFNRAEVAGLHAGFAADAGAVALLFQRNALFRIVAADVHRAPGGTHGKHVLRASRNALLAALTLLLIDDRDLLDRVNMDCAERAGALTGAQTQTGILTGLGAVVDHRSGDTVRHALIFRLGLAVVAIALTGHGRNHASGSVDAHAHDFAHLCGAGRTAHCAGADLSLALGNRSRITVAARVAAGAAVRARQTFAQRFRLFIGGHLEHAASDAQQRAKDQTENAHHERRSQN